jgi:hypothetical protein
MASIIWRALGIGRLHNALELLRVLKEAGRGLHSSTYQLLLSHV